VSIGPARKAVNPFEEQSCNDNSWNRE